MAALAFVEARFGLGFPGRSAHELILAGEDLFWRRETVNGPVNGRQNPSVGLDVKGISMDRLTVLTMFSWQYLLMAFLACLGVVQLAAARSGRRRLWFLRRRRSVVVLGVVLLVAGIAFFYLIPLWTAGPWGPPSALEGTPTWGPAPPETLTSARNINDTAGGLSGYWQALWFAVAWIAAALFTRAIGRVRRPIQEEKPGDQDRRILAGATVGDRP
jgi:hypothetical protein